MRNFILLLVLFLSINLTFAIEVNKKFGKVSKEELSMKVYEKDSSAEAVILFDIGKTFFRYTEREGFEMNHERHVRIKILKKGGLDNADFSIALFKDNETDRIEKLANVKALTFNLEKGKIVTEKFKIKNVYKVKDSKNKTLKNFSLPSVKVGSVIEVSYTIRSNFFYNLQEWYFQNNIPTLWSEYTVEIPDYFRYNKIGKGYLDFVINESKTESDHYDVKVKTTSNTMGGVEMRSQNNYEMQRIDYNKRVIHLAVKDAPAFKNEAYMLSSDNYISMVEFELSQIQFPNSKLYNYTESWESLNKTLLNHDDFGQRLKNSKFLSEVVEGIKAKTTDPNQQVLGLYNYVRNNYKWNETNSIFTSKYIRTTFVEKDGNSADLNLLMVIQKNGWERKLL